MLLANWLLKKKFTSLTRETTFRQVLLLIWPSTTPTTTGWQQPTDTESESIALFYTAAPVSRYDDEEKTMVGDGGRISNLIMMMTIYMYVRIFQESMDSQ